jgi:hypothetical protein
MTTEVAQTTFIEQELQKFDVVEAKLIELAKAGKGLKIASPDDKTGIETVKKARIAIKNERVRIEKKGKELRDQATKFNKAVLAKEKEYLAIIVPTEDELQAEEKRISDEQERIDRSVVEAKQIKTYGRLNALSAVGFVIDYSRAESMTDEQFEKELSEATAQHTAEQKRLAEQKEAQRIEAERLAAEKLTMELKAAELKKEQDRIAKEQADRQKEIELAAQKVRLEQEAVEQQRKQQVEHERQLQLAAEREKHLREQAENDRIAKERLAEENRLAGIELENRLAEANEQRLKEAAALAERNRVAAIENERLRIEKEAADKLERERLATIEAKRQADLAPDKEKLAILATAISNYELPTLTMPDAETVINNVRGLLDKVSAYINQQIDKL